MIETKGAELSDDEIRYTLRFAATAPSTTYTELTLFGEQSVTRSLALEKAKLAAEIEKRLSSEKIIFGAAARGAGLIEQRGIGKISQPEAQQASVMASQARAVFRKLADKAGLIGTALDQAAKEIDAGGNPREAKARLYEAVIRAVEETLSRSEQPNLGLGAVSAASAPAAAAE